MFLPLQHVVAPPPLPLLVGLLLSLGVIALGRVVMALFGGGGVEKLAGPLLGLALVGVIIQSLAFAGIATLSVVRAFAVAIGLAGCLALVRLIRRPGAVRDLLRCFFAPPWPRGGFFAALLGAVILLGLALTALGPVTSLDSTNYHFGVGLLTLATGHVGLTPAWFNAHVAGLGEFSNALGLAAGSDSFASIQQILALAVILLVIAHEAEDPRSRWLAVLLVLSIPIWLFLVPSAKPSLVPSAGLVIAAALLARAAPPTPRQRALIAVLIAIAIANRFTLCLPAAVLGVWLVARSLPARRGMAAVLMLAGAFVLIAAPMMLYRALTFGDPLSPMLAGLLGETIPGQRAYAEQLRQWTDSGFPTGLNLFLPAGFGTITAVFLYAPFIGMAFLGFRRRLDPLIVAAMAATALDFALGQQIGRFYIDPFFWLCLAVSRSKAAPSPLFFWALLPQLALMAGLSAFGALRLFPGALSSPLREQVMAQNSDAYRAMAWLDAVLPKDAVLLFNSDQHALSPRPVVFAQQTVYMAAMPPSTFAYYKALAMRRGATLAVTIDTPGAQLAALQRQGLGACFSRRLLGPKLLRSGRRNPFNREMVEVDVWSIDYRRC